MSYAMNIKPGKSFNFMKLYWSFSMLPLFLTEFASLHIESQYFYLNHPPPIEIQYSELPFLEFWVRNKQVMCMSKEANV